MPKYLSGRVRRTSQDQLSNVRYTYLKLDDAEPNLGDPILGTTPVLPSGDQYIMVSIPGAPGERFWIPKGGGLIPGSITVYEENLLIGGISSTTQINFMGEAIKVTSNATFVENTLNFSSNQSFNVGIAITQVDTDSTSPETVATGLVKISTTNVGFVTLTNVSGSFNTTEELYYNGNPTGVIPSTTNPVIDASEQVKVEVSPEFLSLNNQVIFNDNDEFDGAEGLVYFKNESNLYNNVGLSSVGIGTTAPQRTLHVGGDVKLDGTIYDFLNQPGSSGSIFTRGVNGVEWKPPTLVQTAAGGTITNIQYHGAGALNDGASDFVYIENIAPTANQVGIGTTAPGSGNILDVRGKAQFNDLHSSDSEFDGDVKFIGTNSSTRYLLWDKSDNKALLTDDVKLSFGDSNDLQIYHDSADTKIENDTGKLYITNNDAVAANRIYIQPKENQDGIQIVPDGEVGLYYAGSEKLKTLTSGINVTGLTETDELKVTGIATIDTILPESTSSGSIGTEGTKWNEIWATAINAELKGHASTAQTSVDADNIQIHNNDTTDKNHFIHFGNDIASDIFTITDTNHVNDSEDKITIENHKLETGDKVHFNVVSVGSTIPGLFGNQFYYVIKLNDDAFNLTDNLADAISGTNIINLTGGLTGEVTFTSEDRYDPVSISRSYLSYNPHQKRLGIGTNNPSYSLDFGPDSGENTIRIVSKSDGTAIRVGAGGANNDVTLLRVDGSSAINGAKGISDNNAQGFSVKYISGSNAANDSFNIVSDNQSGNVVKAVTIIQDGTVGINQENPDTSYALDVNGDINATTVHANLSGNSTTATDLNATVATGQGGKIVYQGDGSNNTLFLSQPTENGTYYLSYDHTNDAPEWVDLVEATVGVGSTTKNSDHYLVFVDTNNESRTEETLYTNGGIKVNPSTKTVTIDGGLTVDGNVTLGDNTSDDIAINGKVTADIIPKTNSVDANTGNTLGSQNQKWKKVYAREFQGQVIGIASQAIKLKDSRNFSIDGTLTHSDFTVSTNSNNNDIEFVDVEVGINTNMFTGISTDGIKVNQQLRLKNAQNLNETTQYFSIGAKVSSIGIGTVYLSEPSNVSTSNTSTVQLGYWNTVGHVYATPVSFNGTDNVVLNGNLKDQNQINPAQYGSAVQIPLVTVNQQGLITDIENIGVDFTNSTVLNADNVSVGSSSEEAGSQNIYLVGVNTNASTRGYKPLYTDGQLYYNPENDYLTTENLHVVGVSSLLGNITLGDSNGDDITFNGSVNSNIIPDTGTFNLGSETSKWNRIFTNEVVGELVGSASSIVVSALSDQYGEYGGVTTTYDIGNTVAHSSITMSSNSFSNYIKRAFDSNDSYYNNEVIKKIRITAVNPEDSGDTQTIDTVVSSMVYDPSTSLWTLTWNDTITYNFDDTSNPGTPLNGDITATIQSSNAELNLLLGNIGVTSAYADSTLKYDNVTNELQVNQLKVSRILTGAGGTGTTDQVIMKQSDGTWTWQTITSTNTSLSQGIEILEEDSSLSTGVEKLNFVGDTITATLDSVDNTKAIITAKDTTVDSTNYGGNESITVSAGNDIKISDSSNAYGRRFIDTVPPLSQQGNVGDLWFDISGTTASTVTNSLGEDGATPVGGIIMWSGGVSDISNLIGWKLCNGTAITAQDDPNNLSPLDSIPDLTNKFIVGADADTTIDSVIYPSTTITGSVTTTGGDKDAVLIAHSHATWNQIGGTGNNVGGTGSATESEKQTGKTGKDENQNTSTTETGVNKNLPPYYALAYIIRIF